MPPVQTGLRTVEREAPLEDGEPSEDGLLISRQQLIAPGDGRVQRLLPSGQIARPRPSVPTRSVSPGRPARGWIAERPDQPLRGSPQVRTR